MSKTKALPEKAHVSPEAVVIGVSAGGLKALSAILPTLPADYPLPIMVVIHLPPSGKSIVADLFAEKCALHVTEAEDKDDIASGTVYFAPPDYHMLVEQDRTLSLSNEEPVQFSRPSIDVLFESAADAYGPALVGIVLTGANDDGARGLKVIAEAGGIALVQSPQHAFASAMPEAALEATPQARALELDEISAYLVECVAS